MVGGGAPDEIRRKEKLEISLPVWYLLFNINSCFLHSIWEKIWCINIHHWWNKDIQLISKSIIHWFPSTKKSRTDGIMKRRCECQQFSNETLLNCYCKNWWDKNILQIFIICKIVDWQYFKEAKVYSGLQQLHEISSSGVQDFEVFCGHKDWLTSVLGRWRGGASERDVYFVGKFIFVWVKQTGTTVSFPFVFTA